MSARDEPTSLPLPSLAQEVRGLVRSVVGAPLVALSAWRSEPVPGVPVMVLPGYLTTDLSTRPLRAFLGHLGHRVYPWELGRNVGELEQTIPVVTQRVRELAEREGQPVHLIGWSLGGLVARGVARRSPEAVAQLITMGTPIQGGSLHTIFGKYSVSRGVDLRALARRADAAQRLPVPVPMLVMYSKRDAIVAWQACLDPNPNNQVEHVEVRASNLEMGFRRHVLQHIARRLANPPPRRT